MADQDRVVTVHFVNDQKISIPSPDPENLLQTITNKETGWFTYEHVVFKREHVTHAYIKTPRSNKARAVKPYGL
ncbi:hypothetical protein BK129_14800 [Paenibacillus amylolyticus]|uniref:hypothetical protein n=1 Tax=Paenibacillus amylolyticus TaxID=1451 RepID=UPI00096C300F|nr:hypothetical protein [Paenibacillus amylolyticus]OMF05253.1 hypothetical protein BK129_14800 [Paenibacillus amylolyticus]